MPCLVKSIPTERIKVYGGGHMEPTKDLPQKRTESYSSSTFGCYGRLKTPSSRVSEYTRTNVGWNVHTAPNYRCSREAYCVIGKGKQWVVVRLGEAAETNLEETFETLSRRWRDEIGADSSLSNILGNINYLRVIALGRKVLPLILAQLQREPLPWFTALRAITGENPVDAQSAGDFRKMAEEWLQWGRERGLINGQVAP